MAASEVAIELDNVHSALCDAANDRKNHQPKDVVDDRCGEDDLASLVIEQSLGRKDLRGDADAGGDHRRADEDRLHTRLAPNSKDAPTEKERDDNAQEGHQQCRGSHTYELARFHLESDPEQKKHDAQVGECEEHLVRLYPTQDAGADQHPGKDLADGGGLAEALEDFGEELGSTEDGEHRERDVRRVRREREQESRRERNRHPTTSLANNLSWFDSQMSRRRDGFRDGLLGPYV